MRSYQNVVWDIIENYFDEFNITSIHREDNQQEDAFSTISSTFKPLPQSKLKYEVEMRCIPSIPYNIKLI